MRKYLLPLLLLTWATSASGAYITDKLLAGLYPKPDTQTQPIKVVPSGTPMEILETQDGFSRVRLGDNSEGWVEQQFITDEKPARVMLLQLQAKNSQLQRQLQQAGSSATAPTNSSSDTSEALQQAQQQIRDLQQRLSARPDNTADEEKIRELEQALEKARQAQSDPAIEELRQQNQALQERMQQAASLLGAASDTTPQSTTDETTQHFDLWRMALALLALLLGFVGGVLFKNYRLAKRYGGFRI